MRWTMTVYKVERVTKHSDELDKFLKETCPEISKMFGSKFNHERAAVHHMINKGYFLIGRRNGEIRGIHISWLMFSPLDMTKKILHQQLFYVKPDSGRMAYHLFEKFIDIGKGEADHIITMLTSRTNIKPCTLESKGFKMLEVLYRLEVSK